MALFTDTVTIFHGSSKKIVEGVQWSEKTERTITDKKISVAKYISVTFPEKVYNNIPFNEYDEHTCMIYGAIKDEVSEERGKRISDLMKNYERSGFVRVINDNSNRSKLKHIKVVLE